MFLLKKYFFVVFFIVQIVFVQILHNFPALVEKFYSNFIFVSISHFLRLLFGKIPFSIGDLIYLITILYLISSVYKSTKNWKANWNTYLLRTVNFVSVFYFLFHFLWGFNYYRQPLFEKINLKKEYTSADLYAFTEKLINKTNQLQLEITKNKNLKVQVPFTNDSLIAKTQNGYDYLAKKYHLFSYKTPSIKTSLFSVPLSYMGFSGYLNPFTNEAQFNSKVPKYGLPMTICHEMAHQIGYASESECNFIGYLAANSNSDLYFKYAANTLVLKYCLRTIQINNESKATLYLSKINKGIIDNFNEDKAFYKRYHSFIETGFEFFYDNFLKLNQQKDGMEGYSKFLDLLINFDNKNVNFI